MTVERTKHYLTTAEYSVLTGAKRSAKAQNTPQNKKLARKQKKAQEKNNPNKYSDMIASGQGSFMNLLSAAIKDYNQNK